MNKLVIAVVLILLLVAVGVFLWMRSGISDVNPNYPWKKIYYDTNWASGSNKALNMKPLTLNQCMNHALDNGRPGFTYNAPTQNCMLKNSYGRGSMRPNSPGWTTYIA